MVGSDQFHTDALLDGLGVEFLSAGTEHKPYASCRWTHSAIEAADRARRLLDESDVDSIDTIASIDVDWFGDPATFDVVTPLDGIDAQFSLPFLVGAALAGSAPTTHIGEQELHSPTIRGLAEKVTVTKVAEFARAFATGGRPARVTVTCSSGRRFVETVEVPMGHPARRLTWDAVCAKSESLVSPVLGEKAANRLIERCRDLESLDGIASLWDEVFE
jgi:2-methylcitrate dehydratase PrpD